MKGMEASKSGNLQRSGLWGEGVFWIVPVVMKDTYGLGTVLINEAKLTEFGAASQDGLLSKEDERSAKLAERARNGDYDDGAFSMLPPSAISSQARTYSRTIIP